MQSSERNDPHFSLLMQYLVESSPPFFSSVYHIFSFHLRVVHLHEMDGRREGIGRREWVSEENWERSEWMLWDKEKNKREREREKMQEGKRGWSQFHLSSLQVEYPVLVNETSKPPPITKRYLLLFFCFTSLSSSVPFALLLLYFTIVFFFPSISPLLIFVPHMHAISEAITKSLCFHLVSWKSIGWCPLEPWLLIQKITKSFGSLSWGTMDQANQVT